MMSVIVAVKTSLYAVVFHLNFYFKTRTTNVGDGGGDLNISVISVIIR